MSSDPLDDLHSDASPRNTSRAGSWIVTLLHPKVAIPLVLILLLISAPLVFRAVRLSRVPPTGEPFELNPVLEFAVPDSDNAFVEYRAARGLLVRRDPKVDQDVFEKAQSDGWESATEPVRKWLDANRPFMELWRKGTAKSDAQYLPAWEYRSETEFNEVHEAREFSRLVRLESSRLLAEGQPEEAWDWLRTSFRMSRQIGRHGPVMERLIGTATHALTAEGIVKWANDPQVTSDQLRRAVRELQIEQQRTPLFSKSMEVEYLSVMASWKNLSDGPADATLNRLTGEAELYERTFRHLFTEWIARAKERDQRLRGVPENSSPSNLKPRPSAAELNSYVSHVPVAVLLVSSMNQIFVATDREAARDRLLLTVLALELFARKHGDYPEQLDELVPEFLPAILDDVHGPPKSPLQYRREGAEALIYSIGTNGTDDGGAFEKAEDIGYRIGKPRP